MNKGVEFIMQVAELIDRASTKPILWLVFGVGVAVRLVGVLIQTVPSDPQAWLVVIADAVVYGVAAVWAYEKRPAQGGTNEEG